MKIVYLKEDGGIAVLQPTDELPIQQVARKDVPFQVPYIFADDSVIPEDRTFRNAWSADFSNPDGYGLGPQRWFIEQAETEIAQIDARPQTNDPAILKARQDRVAELQALIERMKAEVLQIEGVHL
ncbi:MAG TPA: hypothetical protein VFV57_05990 [Limnobacter sp.]|nr:hypothetical protein [Limnobacter sp.]